MITLPNIVRDKVIFKIVISVGYIFTKSSVTLLVIMRTFKTFNFNIISVCFGPKWL